VCGSEPIQSPILSRFVDHFASCGFSADTIYPCYGLAEATLIVTGRRGFEPAKIVSCGPIAEGQRVEIVDPTSEHRVAAGDVGEIWVSGDNVASGYWPADSTAFAARLPDDSRPYLRTGDLGYLQAGELHVTDRIKELIIIGGANHHPADIEQTVASSHEAFRTRSVAAFAVQGDEGERLVVLAELRSVPGVSEADLIAAARAAIAQTHQLGADVVLVRSGSIPKTTSGKLQRRLVRQRYLAGELTEWRAQP